MDVEHAKELLIKERDRLEQIEDQFQESSDLDESQGESGGALADYNQHVGDAASQTFQRERDVSIEERLELKRNEVSDALERIENDDYGRCEVCGREISDERLGAIPATRYCAEHASDAEDQSLKGGWSITNDLGPEDR